MDIFAEAKSAGLPLGEYVVICSGAMTAHGIRQHNDVDFVVTKDLFEKLKSEGWETKSKNAIFKGNFEAYINFRREGYAEHDEELIRGADIINGVAFMTLEEVVKFKRAYGREKDLRDVKLIEDYLEKQK